MIKFRGIPLRDAENIYEIADYDGTFVYGYFVKKGDNTMLIVSNKTEELDDIELYQWFIDVDPETVGQFTSLKDVNGKNIYEGDIVENERGKILRVSYSEIGASFVVGNCYFGSIGAGKEIEIIGNVPANPELLEEDK